MKCPGAEGRCNFTKLYGDGLCLMHSATAEAAEKRAENGRKGGARSNAARRDAQRAQERSLEEIDLETSSGRLSELMLALLAVERSSCSATSKATAIARLVAEARAEVRGVELEDAYTKLRDLVLERMPQVAALLPPQLKAVSR